MASTTHGRLWTRVLGRADRSHVITIDDHEPAGAPILGVRNGTTCESAEAYWKAEQISAFILRHAGAARRQGASAINIACNVSIYAASRI